MIYSGFLPPVLMWCISFIFTLQRYSFFFIYARKTTIIFQKKCTFLCIFLAVRKSPAFYTLHMHTYNNKTTSWTHNNNVQHTTNTLPGNHNTHTQEQDHDRAHIQQTHTTTTWTPEYITHTTHTTQGKHKAMRTHSNVNTWTGGNSAQCTRWTRWTRKRKHKTKKWKHAQTHEQEKTHTRENTCICIINKK